VKVGRFTLQITSVMYINHNTQTQQQKLKFYYSILYINVFVKWY